MSLAVCAAGGVLGARAAAESVAKGCWDRIVIISAGGMLWMTTSSQHTSMINCFVISALMGWALALPTALTTSATFRVMGRGPLQTLISLATGGAITYYGVRALMNMGR